MDEDRQKRKTLEQMSAAVGQYANRQGGGGSTSYPLLLLNKGYLVKYRPV